MRSHATAMDAARQALCLLFCLSTGTVKADFPELFNTEPETSPPAMSADVAAAEMTLPPGFRASAFASEPAVQNPIAMAWDARGRLWVAENYTYAERGQRFQLDLRDRVVIFDGTDRDKFTQRTVFTDQVQMLTGLEVGVDGVWLMCPPKLIFIPDRDHDDVPDHPGEVVLDGFTVAQQNYHNFANGLRFGPDGWLYGRCGGSCPGRIGRPGTPENRRLALEGGIWRYHPRRKTVEVLTTGTCNPWGHDWNDVGELFFVNTVNGHLWHASPGAHFTRPFTLDPNPRTYELIDFHADHWHFDTGQSWTKSRDGAANSYGGGHAHAGAMIYRGLNWPERYRGKLFTLNLHGRRANQEIPVRRGGGYELQHGDDFFLAKDEWFRGMELSAGPDGAVFVLDWSDAGECHEHTGVHRTSGRVFKIRYQAQDADWLGTPPPFDLRDVSSTALAKTHTTGSAWHIRQARLVLTDRAARRVDVSEAVSVLTELFRATEDSAQAVQALKTLHLIGAAEPDFLAQQLTQHRDEYVAACALRLLADRWPIDDANGPGWQSADDLRRVQADVQARRELLNRAAQRSPLVRRTLASVLQRIPVEHRPNLAASLVRYDEDADDHNLPLLIWYGLIPVAESHADKLVAVAEVCRLPTTLRLISRCVAEEIEAQPAAINGLLSRVLSSGDEGFQHTVLVGIASGLKGWRSAPEPTVWKRVAALKNPRLRPLINELSAVFGDGRAIAELKAIAMKGAGVEASVRIAALETLIQSEPDDLRQICESLMKNQQLNVIAARGLSKFDDPHVGKLLVERYRNIRGPFRPQIVSILCSRPTFAGELLDAIGAGKIPRSDLTAYQVRQIHSLGDRKLSQRVAETWGQLRETSEERQQLIDQLKRTLTPAVLAAADKSAGRQLFVKQCRNCHRLYGDGERIGPDLTGANRSNLDYLLSNIVDPSGVVDKDFRMTILATDDNRVLNGLVIAENERTLTMQTATELLTLDKRSIEHRRVTTKSPMPDGLLDSLSEEQIQALVSYLQHPSQVPLP